MLIATAPQPCDLDPRVWVEAFNMLVKGEGFRWAAGIAIFAIAANAWAKRGVRRAGKAED